MKEKGGGLPRNLVVVIGRQYGSGGRKLGHKLAERLGLTYYDKELMNEAARSFGYDPEILVDADEKKPASLASLFLSALGVNDSYGPSAMSGEGLYKVQSHVIRELGTKGGCVIVGRTADYILRHHPHMASIFLHSPLERRAERMIRRGEYTAREEAISRLKKEDRKRESYYNYFTGRRWGAADNYDLTIDTALIGDDAAVEIIEHFLNHRFGKQ